MCKSQMGTKSKMQEGELHTKALDLVISQAFSIVRPNKLLQDLNVRTSLRTFIKIFIVRTYPLDMDQIQLVMGLVLVFQILVHSPHQNLDPKFFCTTYV